MDDSSIKKPNEKKYHLDMHYLDHPVRFGEISLIQLGRLHCTNHTVIDMHSHRTWFEITVATDGEAFYFLIYFKVLFPKFVCHNSLF